MKMETNTQVDEQNLESLSKEELIDLVKQLSKNKRKRTDSQPKGKQKTKKVQLENKNEDTKNKNPQGISFKSFRLIQHRAKKIQAKTRLRLFKLQHTSHSSQSRLPWLELQRICVSSRH
jgi:hypothetical protein